MASEIVVGIDFGTTQVFMKLYIGLLYLSMAGILAYHGQ